MNMEKQLLEIINRVLANSEKPLLKQLDRGLHLRNDIGFNSFDLAELTVRIEEKFDVDIFEDGIVSTVEETVLRIRSKKQ